MRQILCKFGLFTYSPKLEFMQTVHMLSILENGWATPRNIIGIREEE